MPMPPTTTTPTEKPTSTPIPYLPTGTMSQRITKRQTSRQSGKGRGIERERGRQTKGQREREGGIGQAQLQGLQVSGEGQVLQLKMNV